VRTVWKYVLGDDMDRALNVTLSAPRIVFVGLDPASDRPAVWIEHIEDGTANVAVALTAIGTGWVTPDHSSHVGSVIQGPFVWHIYARYSRAVGAS